MPSAISGTTPSADASSDRRNTHGACLYVGYALALIAGISLWFTAIHAPLWEDETGSWWLISSGVSRLWERHDLLFPAYPCILWLSTRLLGSSEIVLRIPSVVAMLGAAGVMYRVAREVFNRELALVATILFCVNPIVIFAAVDVRPYAFAVLAVNTATLVLLRLRHTDSGRVAALFGALAALVIWFHYLFAVILPGYVVAYWSIKRADRKSSWMQFAVAATVFCGMMLPVVPGLKYLFHTSGSHVFEQAPTLQALSWTLALYWAGPAFIIMAIVALLFAALRLQPDQRIPIRSWQIVVCLSLGLVPVLILFGVSEATPIHIFVERHRLVAVPGLALCWVCILSRVPHRILRLGFCLGLVGLTSYAFVATPDLRQHMFSWKSAIGVVESNASVDGAPVLMCSDFPEADYAILPDINGTKASRYFAPLSYYQLTVPVYGMPRSLNDQAKRRGTAFVQIATQRHERFLAMAYEPSYPILDWISRIAGENYDVHTVGVYDHIKVLEFDPRSPRQAATGVRVNQAAIPAK